MARAKKSFDVSEIDTGKKETGVNTGAVFSTIEKGQSSFRRQGVASPEEQYQRANQMKTQGRKGCKASRINMAITPENYQFIKVMSRTMGMTLTEFTNLVLTQYRNEHPEIYEQAKVIIEMAKNIPINPVEEE